MILSMKLNCYMLIRILLRSALQMGAKQPVSTKILAPRGHQQQQPYTSFPVNDYTGLQKEYEGDEKAFQKEEQRPEEPRNVSGAEFDEASSQPLMSKSPVRSEGTSELRRSSRVRKPVDRLNV